MAAVASGSQHHDDVARVTRLLGRPPLGDFEVVVRDNGVGLPEESAVIRNGLGLRNMKARATDMQARFDISSSPGEGSCLKIEIPKP